MKKFEEKLKILSEKYKLDFGYFVIENKDNILKKKYLVYYGFNKYYYEASHDSCKSKNYFPYFDFSKETDLENWLSSIQITLIKKSRLLKSIKDGKISRNIFKEKFKV
jgi:hypothetical protein